MISFYTDEFQCQFNIVLSSGCSLGKREHEALERVLKLGRVNEFLKRQDFDDLCEQLQHELCHVVTEYNDDERRTALVVTNGSCVTPSVFPYCNCLWFTIRDDFSIEISWGVGNSKAKMFVTIQLPMEGGYLQELDSCAVLDTLQRWNPKVSCSIIEFYLFYKHMWEKYHFVWISESKCEYRIWMMAGECDEGKPEFNQHVADVLKRWKEAEEKKKKECKDETMRKKSV